MGLFSSKTIISVASSVYNMAGDELNRPIFHQNLIIRNILSGTKRSLGDTTSAGYLHGPGIKFRSFFRWADDNYDLVGMPTGTMYAGDTIDTQVVAEHVPQEVAESVWVQEASLADSDYGMWAEQWIIQNRPEDLNGVWEADFDDATNTVTIVFEDETTVSFEADDFVAGDKYIYAYYTVSVAGTEEPVEEGIPSPLAPGEPFPSTAGYTLVSEIETPRNEVLETTTTVVNSFSDGRPNTGSTTTETETASVIRVVEVYEKEGLGTPDPEIDAMVVQKDIRRLVTDKEVLTEVTTTTVEDEIEPGVIRTRTTIITEDFLEDNNYYRDDIQIIYPNRWEPLNMWIYRLGTGILELDALLQEVESYGQFYPMIPIRLDNKFLSEISEVDVPNIVEIEEVVERAYHKGTDGGHYSKLLDELSDNEDLEDMDYIYAVYGVSLNVIDRSCRRYIYEFLKRLMISQEGGADVVETFAEKMEEYRVAYEAWEDWRDNPVYPPAPKPVLPSKPTLPQNELKIQNIGEDGSLNINYDIRLIWNYITETHGTGLGKPGAKKGQFWLEMVEPLEEDDPLYTGIDGPLSNGKFTTEIMRIWWQYEDNAYRYMDVAGLVHKNYVYEGKHVTITAKEALDDSEESGFIIPLHYATYREMRLVDATQMGTACVFLVFNVYQKTKKKWWQRGFFKILFVVVVAIVSVVVTGGAGIGLLGSHLAVGGALGLTGMTAAIVGAVANSLAALVLSTIITKLTENLGWFGALIGAVLTIAITGAMNSFHAGNGFNFDFSQLMKAENIMKLMDAAGQGYTAYARSSIIDMQNELIEFQEDANAELRRVREAYMDQFGYGGGQIDPMMFVADNSPVMAESRDSFLSRTLMTGSDVAQMSHSLLNDYVELNLTLPDAFTQ